MEFWEGAVREGRKEESGEEWGQPSWWLPATMAAPQPLDAGVKERRRDGNTHPLGHHN